MDLPSSSRRDEARRNIGGLVEAGGGDVDPLAQGRDRPLTFRPAVDDRDKLTNFLKGVVVKHLDHRRRALQGRESKEATGQAATAKTVARMPQGLPRLSSISVMGSPLSEAPTSTRATKSSHAIAKPGARDASRPRPALGKRKSTPTKTQAKSRRRSRAPNNASLLRAKSIDFSAPDPEELSPPDETEDERRKRKERINGRRKRAKKMIEIDHLQEHYHTLKEHNEKLKEDNKLLQGKIAMIRDLERSGHIQLMPVGDGGASAEGPASTATVMQPSSSQPSASQDASCPEQVPPVSYAAASPARVSALVALANQGLQAPPSRLQQEETKESIWSPSQPQHVGFGRLGLSLPHGVGITAAPNLPWMPGASTSNQVHSHLNVAPAQQQLMPLTVSLFSGLVQQQQQQQQQQAMNLRAVHSQAQRQASLLSPFQQIMYQWQQQPPQQSPAGLPPRHRPAPGYNGPPYQGHDRQPPPS